MSTGEAAPKKVIEQRGLWYEEFEPDVIYQHRPGRTITEADVTMFAMLSGDYDEIHTSEHWAREHSAYKTRIAHGMLSAGFISAVLGNQLPGPGSIDVRQDARIVEQRREGDDDAQPEGVDGGGVAAGIQQGLEDGSPLFGGQPSSASDH